MKKNIFNAKKNPFCYSICYNAILFVEIISLGNNVVLQVGCHFFTIIFAVAPQFYTPEGSVDLDVLLTLETR